MNATHLIIATDVDNVWVGKEKTPLRNINKNEIKKYYEKGEFPEGSMGPKVEAACDFVQRSGGRAVIGSLSDMQGMVDGTAGTQFVLE